MKYKNLRIELAKRNMTKRDLFEKLKEKDPDFICYSTFDRQLNGNATLRFNTAGAISKFLDADMEYLFEETDR